MEWLSIVADIVGIAGAVISLMVWLELRREKARRNRKITIVLQYGMKPIEVPVKLRRADATRAEILGYIGMIPTKTGGRFTIAYLASPKFSEQMDRVLNGRDNTILTIPLTEKEFEQFVLPPN